MSINYAKKVVKFDKFTGVEEAEGLFEWLQSDPQRKVNLGQAIHIHTAVLQLLMFLKPPVSVWPKEPQLAGLLQQILNESE